MLMLKNYAPKCSKTSDNNSEAINYSERDADAKKLCPEVCSNLTQQFIGRQPYKERC